MVKSIPIFQLQITEGIVDIDTSADRLFGYCIEATKGPVMDPMYVASNTEAKNMFGVDFAPHFYQNPTGVVLCRVGFEGMSKSSITYQVLKRDNPATGQDGQPLDSEKLDALRVTAKYEGAASYKVNVSRSITSTKYYNLTVTIDGVTSKKYQNLPNLQSVAKKINNNFDQYLHAEVLFDEQKASGLSATECLYQEGTEVVKKTTSTVTNDNKSKIIIEGPLTAARLLQNKEGGVILDSLSGGSNGKLLTTMGEISNMEIPNTGLKEGMSGTGTEDDDPNVDVTLLNAYRKAFEKMKEIDLIGVSTLSRSEVVQNELIEHIVESNDPEVARLRFGVTGFLDYPEEGESNVITIDNIAEKAALIDNEMMLFIGQGVVFENEGTTRNLYPYQAVQLYTGIRSALGYSEAIFGGEKKKVLNGVKDVLPLTNDGVILIKEDREQLNEAGVMTFKKEYNEVTFLEGVTTIQDHDVLSYESIMSIAVYVTKRLIKVAKPYQGQLLTEDLKATLTQALSNELKNIMDTDKTLIPIEEYNIPPYDVEVKSSSMIQRDEQNNIIRESKIIIRAKIVPAGALRDIDLGVIII